MDRKRPDFDDLPGPLIRRLNQIATALFRDHMSDTGLEVTPVQFAVMNALSDTPGLDQASLAEAVAYDKVTIGGVVDRLVDKGLVDRKPSQTDKRAKSLRLTQTGVVALDRMQPNMRTLQDHILGGLNGAEQCAFVALLKKAARHHGAR